MLINLNKKSAVAGVRLYLTVLLYFVHKLVLPWLRGFQDTLLYFVLFSLCPSLLGIERQKKLKKIESLGTILYNIDISNEAYYIAVL